MFRWLVLVCLGLFLSGCGGSGQIGDLGSPGVSTAGPVEFPLRGIWGGYFPGSSLDNPKAGLEIHFERRSSNVFIHRLSGPATRSRVAVQRSGNDVVLSFPGAQGDDSTFSGSFVSPDRIRGRFQNLSRNENFTLELVSADSALPLTDLRPATPAAGLLTGSQPSPPYNTLRIETRLKDNMYAFVTGLGYYFTPGSFRVNADYPPPGESDDWVRYNIYGTSAVLQLAFYPDWIVFDLYDSVQQLSYMASIEVKMTDFAQVTTERREISASSSSVVGAFPLDYTPDQVWMYYMPTQERFDASKFATQYAPGVGQHITISGQDFFVPHNAAALLSGFRGVTVATP